MNRLNLYEYLNLDSYDVKISFSQTKSEILKQIEDNKINIDKIISDKMYEWIYIKSNLFSLDMVFIIAFRFEDEKLLNVGICPKGAIEGKLFYKRCKVIQKALTNILGLPHVGSNIFWNIIFTDSKIWRWNYKNIKIEHSVYERFGMQDDIGISW